jgi:hypothetical protein
MQTVHSIFFDKKYKSYNIGPQVPRKILENRIASANTRKAKLEAIAELDALLSKRRVMTGVTQEIVTRVTGSEEAAQAVLDAKLKVSLWPVL